MVDQVPQFEQEDNAGSTVVHGGAGGTTYDTINTTGVDVPKTNSLPISGFEMVVGNVANKKVLVSFDGGSTFKEFQKFDYYSANIKGGLTSLKVKTDTGTIAPGLVEFTFNLEPQA